MLVYDPVTVAGLVSYTVMIFFLSQHSRVGLRSLQETLAFLRSLDSPSTRAVGMGKT